MKTAIIVNLTKEKAITCAARIIEILSSAGAELVMPSECAPWFKDSKVAFAETVEKLFEMSDLAVTVGGDGTIIHAAKFAARALVPLIGVNVGRLGFAADVEPEEIEDLIISNVDPSDRLTGTGIGRTYDASDDARRIYEDHLMRTVDFKLLGKKIVLDCANGACFKVAPEVFMRLGADVYTIGNTPDGTNINDRCGSTAPESLSRAVREIGAQAGFAFDGDGDRLITVDEEGRILDGDRAVGICAMDLKGSGRLDNMVVTTSVMSNSGLWKTLEEEGIPWRSPAWETDTFWTRCWRPDACWEASRRDT